jgi:hypothetical protein
MRVGFNPHRDIPKNRSAFIHQVVIPVYIPNFDGYFAGSFTNFKLCLGSLFGTCHDRTYITVVDNGSHPQVGHYLDTLFSEGRVNEVIHTENIGKINAAVKGIAGHNIELVTIADADVMFLSGWQMATNNLFDKFPKAGVVGVVPIYKSFAVYCENIIFDNFWSKKLKLLPFKNRDGLWRFYQSIGHEALDEVRASLSVAIEANGETAFLGAGHFVATYKRDIFDGMSLYSDFLLGGTSEDYVDALCLKKDYWRLTTTDNYAYHMGNVHEPWMDEVLFKKDPAEQFKSGFKTFSAIGALPYFLKNRVFRKIFRYKRTKRFFYRLKGMPKDLIGKY